LWPRPHSAKTANVGDSGQQSYAQAYRTTGEATPEDYFRKRAGAADPAQGLPVIPHESEIFEINEIVRQAQQRETYS